MNNLDYINKNMEIGYKLYDLRDKYFDFMEDLDISLKQNRENKEYIKRLNKLCYSLQDISNYLIKVSWDKYTEYYNNFNEVSNK